MYQCPKCRKKLQSFEYTPIDKNLKLTINFCPYCEGYLLSNTAVNNLTSKDLKKIKEKTNPKKETAGSETNLVCPECNLEMKEMIAESIPRQVHIFECENCNLRWFPKQELKKFKNAQKKKLDYFKEWNIPLASIFAIILPILLVFLVRKGSSTTEVIEKEPTVLLQETAVSQVKNLEIKTIQPTEKEITFQTDEPTITSFEYGTSKENLRIEPISEQKQTSHSIKLENLAPQKTYFYRIRLKKKGQKTEITELQTFTTEQQ